MTEYRLARPEEENDILDFINFVFSQAHRPHDFRALLPKVYAHPGFSQYHVVAVENGRIRGTVALLPLTLRVSGGDTLSVGYIGSVSAHPYDKGAGHMKKLMNLTLENAEKAGYDLLTLGGQRQRYAYFGFERAEMHRTFRLRTPNVRHALRDVDASAVIIREIQAGDEDLIAAAYALSSAQDMTCLRDRARYLDIMHSWCNRLYAVLDAATGAFEGYLNVSDDYIAEMALVREERLPQVLKAWHQEHGDVTVNVPAHLPARARALKRFAESYELGDGGMLRLMHPARVLAAALRLKHRLYSLPKGRVTVEIAGMVRLALAVTADGVSVEETADTPDYTLTRQEATAMFFSPYAAVETTDLPLAAWLPLPLDVASPDGF